MYETILVPTDGSQEISAVLNQAIELASICDSTLQVLHVVDERAYHSVPEDARGRDRESLLNDAESFTNSAAERALKAAVAVEREIRWGDPAPAILSDAVENRMALIVMGTHGRTGYERYLLGSVAEKVVRMAPMPVMAIAIGDTDEQRREIRTAATPERASGDETRPDEAEVKPLGDRPST